jgi:carboxypeptidase Taq
MENLEKLIKRTAEITNINQTMAVLGWDQQTYMPPGGAMARAEQLTTLSTLSHGMLIADETAKLIDAAQQEVGDLDDGSNEAAMVRMAKRDYDLATKLPSEFVAEITRAATLGHEVWVKARAENNFEHFRPTLEKIVELCRQQAEYLGYTDHIYDALLDMYEPGATTAQVETIFSNLREDLVPFVSAIFENQDKVSDEPIHRVFPIEKQREFGLMVAQKLGFDMQRGRQDEAVHPFCTSFSRDDVRITTRFEEDFLSPALFGTIHETGHAMYEQGLNPEFERTPIGSAVSLGVHESQSRLWENVVGRSRGFWEHFYSPLKTTYSGLLDDVSLEDFYKAINRVQPSLIRVEADEVTYCLHIILRFELEQDLMTGAVAVKDLPDAWNAKMESYLGITPPNNALGVLQDVHWSGAAIGYFSTYALGTLLAAQLYESALKDHPEIPDDIKSGKFSTLLGWMNQNIHAHGRKYTPDELVQRATGQSLSHEAFMRYLKAKFGPIYGV